MNKVKYT